MTGGENPAARWAGALDGWAIPEAILAAAPQSPWSFPARLFRIDPGSPPPLTASHHLATAALEGGGSVLDVGCGGGAASIPLVPPATALTGVDPAPEMLAGFATAAEDAAVAHQEVQGRWPDVADQVPDADVVVCHHVVYNAADIAPFVVALSDHARRLVVVELTERHPQAPLAPLWERFWGLARPDEPSADLLVEVVADLGYRPTVRRTDRPPRKAGLDRAASVAFARRRLCLGADRDPDIDAALGADPERAVTTVVSVAWSPLGRSPGSQLQSVT
ncbi:MAG: class I SAM-dependent methyltransferase [Actinomycetota bacterium]|nr:class I SAM-dependent methyltransferase [Actinomycetota bacterium]